MDMLLIEKLSKDIKKSAETLGEREARYLVDLYYQIQDFRIQCSNQTRILQKSEEGESHECIEFMANNYYRMETYIKKILEEYAKTKQICRWMMSIDGIGPILATGLYCQIDITKCTTAGDLWKFAGLYPGAKKKKGMKCPYNSTLKTLCWKIGQSFIKVSGKDTDVYGHIYVARKKYETEKNDNGDYADYAKQILSEKKFTKATEAKKAYEAGKLPPAHITQRCARYATKIFLSHLFDQWYRLENGTEPPKPFAFGILGHDESHMIHPPKMVA